MKLVKVADLVGKPVAGLKADIRSRNEDGSLENPDQDKKPIIVTMKAVEIKQRGYCCGHPSKRPGTRIDDGKMPEVHIEMEEVKPPVSYEPKSGVDPAVSAHMAALASQQRQNPTAAQAIASQRNGAKGGRPKGVKDKVRRKKAVRRRRKS